MEVSISSTSPNRRLITSKISDFSSHPPSVGAGMAGFDPRSFDMLNFNSFEVDDICYDMENLRSPELDPISPVVFESLPNTQYSPHFASSASLLTPELSGSVSSTSSATAPYAHPQMISQSPMVSQPLTRRHQQLTPMITNQGISGMNLSGPVEGLGIIGASHYAEPGIENLSDSLPGSSWPSTSSVSSITSAETQRRSKVVGQPGIAKKSSKQTLRQRRSKASLNSSDGSGVPQSSPLVASPEAIIPANMAPKKKRSMVKLAPNPVQNKPAPEIVERPIAPRPPALKAQRAPLHTSANNDARGKLAASPAMRSPMRPPQPSVRVRPRLPTAAAAAALNTLSAPPKPVSQGAKMAAAAAAAAANASVHQPHSPNQFMTQNGDQTIQLQTPTGGRLSAKTSPSTIVVSSKAGSTRRLQTANMSHLSQADSGGSYSPTPAARVQSKSKLVAEANDNSPAKGMWPPQPPKTEKHDSPLRTGLSKNRRRGPKDIPEMSSSLGQFQVDLRPQKTRESGKTAFKSAPPSSAMAATANRSASLPMPSPHPPSIPLSTHSQPSIEGGMDVMQAPTMSMHMFPRQQPPLTVDGPMREALMKNEEGIGRIPTDYSTQMGNGPSMPAMVSMPVNDPMRTRAGTVNQGMRELGTRPMNGLDHVQNGPSSGMALNNGFLEKPHTDDRQMTQAMNPPMNESMSGSMNGSMNGPNLHRTNINGSMNRQPVNIPVGRMPTYPNSYSRGLQYPRSGNELTDYHPHTPGAPNEPVMMSLSNRTYNLRLQQTGYPQLDPDYGPHPADLPKSIQQYGIPPYEIHQYNSGNTEYSKRFEHPDSFDHTTKLEPIRHVEHLTNFRGQRSLTLDQSSRNSSLHHSVSMPKLGSHQNMTMMPQGFYSASQAIPGNLIRDIPGSLDLNIINNTSPTGPMPPMPPHLAQSPLQHLQRHSTASTDSINTKSSSERNVYEQDILIDQVQPNGEPVQHVWALRPQPTRTVRQKGSQNFNKDKAAAKKEGASKPTSARALEQQQKDLQQQHKQRVNSARKANREDPECQISTVAEKSRLLGPHEPRSEVSNKSMPAHFSASHSEQPPSMVAYQDHTLIDTSFSNDFIQQFIDSQDWELNDIDMDVQWDLMDALEAPI